MLKTKTMSNKRMDKKKFNFLKLEGIVQIHEDEMDLDNYRTFWVYRTPKYFHRFEVSRN